MSDPVSGDALGGDGAYAPAFLDSPDRGTSPVTATTTTTAAAAAASPLQRRIRHTRLFPPPSPSSSLAPLNAFGSSADLMAQRTALKPISSTTASAAAAAGGVAAAAAAAGTARSDSSSTRPHSLSWQPTRLTSSYCVLSAAGAQEDFYTSALSWGTHQMALALEQSLVLFHPSRPRLSSSTVQITQAPAEAAALYAATSAFHHPRRATAVAMSRCREISCFLGLSNGAVELYEGRGDGQLHCTMAFAMPEPPTDYLSSLLDGHSAATSRAARALSLLSSSVSSVSCVATSDRHPWLGAAATAARGLVALDARQAQPVLTFASEQDGGGEATSAGLSSTASALHSPLSTASTVVSGCDSSSGGALRRLQRASAFLRQHDRLCSASWNATGSLVATGSSGGVVKVWSLSAPQRPLHSFLVDPECTVKALAFHPERPYELLVGGAAGPAGLRSYDLAGAAPVLSCIGTTAAAVTQALYDPAGNYAVTCAGTPLDTPAPVGQRSPLASQAPSTALSQRSPLSAARGERNSPSRGGTGGGGGGWRLTSPALSGSGVNFGPPNSTTGSSVAVPLLQDAWGDDMEEGEIAGDEDALGLVPGLESLRGSGGGGGGAGLRSTTAHDATPNAVMLWRCGSRRRDGRLREALLHHTSAWRDGRPAEGHARRGASIDADDDDDGGENGYSSGTDGESDSRASRRGRPSHHSLAGELRVGKRVGSAVDVEGDFLDDGAEGEDGGVRLEWLPTTTLPGHRARPLLLCAPFSQSPFAGCYASLAAGEDCTVRFWRLFETTSDATHWQHRRQAQQRSATTQEEMDLFTTPVLR